MQRDAYAALVKWSYHRSTPVHIVQLDRSVTHENLLPETFAGFKARRLALMTYTAGQDPRLPRLPRDVVIPTYAALVKAHKPHYVYQLLPLLTADIDTFAVLQAICAAPGSPFSMRDRQDGQLFNYRFSSQVAGRDRICELLKEHTSPAELQVPPATRRLPISQVGFHGLLFRDRIQMPAATAAATASPSSSSSSSAPSKSRWRSSSGGVFVTMHDACSDATIHQRFLMTKLFRSPMFRELCSNSSLMTEVVHGAEHQWHVMGIRGTVGGPALTAGGQRMRAHLLQSARQRDLLLYEQVHDGCFEMAC